MSTGRAYIELEKPIKRVAAKLEAEDVQRKIDERHKKQAEIERRTHPKPRSKYTDEQYNAVMADSKFLSMHELCIKHSEIPGSTILSWVSGTARGPKYIHRLSHRPRKGKK